MSGNGRSSLSGSLCRVGGGLVVIAIGLEWIVRVLRSAWMWIGGAVAGGLVVAGVVAWWRSRSQW